MASTLLSRLLPSTSDHNPPNPRSNDIEHRAALLGDSDSEQPLGDQDLARLLAEGLDDDMMPAGAEHPSSDDVPPELLDPSAAPSNPAVPDDDDDVPASLLLQGTSDRRRRRKSKGSRNVEPAAIPALGPQTRTTRAQWQATQAQQRLHDDLESAPVPPTVGRRPGATPRPLDPRERALWMWTNMDNIDEFLRRLYLYYEEHGIWSILLERAIRLLTALFSYFLLTFVFFCVDYSKIPQSHRLDEVKIPHCTKNLPFLWNAVSWAIIFAVVLNVFWIIQDAPLLWDMHNFYLHMLDIPDRDIQTVSWQYVVSKIMELRDSNPHTATNISAANRRYLRTQSKQRMDAHDIANRLMRRENYWIAMINKDILDCSLNIPFIGKRMFYNSSIEWNISICVMDLVFDKECQVRPEFKSIKRRRELVEVLRKRFWTLGLLNIFMSLPLAAMEICLRFLRSFTEYEKNPSRLSVRKFSPLAEWKIRDFNEVSHLFHRRKRMCYAYANRYLEQFPKNKFNQMVRFAAYVIGALAAILGVVTMWDPELFLGFEIYGRTTLFWLGIMGTIFVAFRNAAADEDDDLWDPEVAMNAVVAHTHYYPDSWKDRLYSEDVRQQFSAMYKLEALLFLDELIGIIVTPLVLMFSLPNCAEQLVDFFREFTVDVDGLGTVCSYALFDFKNGGKAPRQGPGAPGDLREGYYGDKANKMMESYYSFIDHYGPNPRRGLRGRSKRYFHPAPTFPGILGSPSGIIDAYPPTLARHPTGLRQSTTQHHPPPLPLQGTPRVGPAAAQHAASPMHSILLDPHNQPRLGPTAAARAMQRGSSSLTRHNVLDADHPAEADEEDEDAAANAAAPSRQQPALPRTTSNLLENDSDLGDSWMLRGGEPEPGDEEAQDGTSNRVGVLGMIMELQKAQKEVRGGHV